MRTREMYYKHYGISDTEIKKLREYCKNAQDKEKPMILKCCIEANPFLADDLYYSITQGLGYDTLSRVKGLVYPKIDFYGYQRKTLSLIYKAFKSREAL